MPVAGAQTRLLWHKRIWRCEQPACPMGSWREHHPAFTPRRVLSDRARFEIALRVGADNRPVAAVARAFGVCWQTAMRCVNEAARQLFADQDIYTLQRDETAAVGVDEKVMNRVRYRRGRRYVTVIVDLEEGVPLDVVEGRSKATLDGWLAAQSPAWRQAVDTVALDPAAGYRAALRDDEHGLTGADWVLDHFHAARLANRAVDDVRRRIVRELHGRRGRKKDPIYRARKLARMGRHRLDDNAHEKLFSAFAAQDPYEALQCTWVAKELLRDVYAAADRDQAEDQLEEFYQWAGEVKVDEVTRLAGTIGRWHEELLAYFDTGGASTGPVEAINGEIEELDRIARGFRNFDNYRTRILLTCAVDWPDTPTPKLRGPNASNAPATPCSTT